MYSHEGHIGVCSTLMENTQTYLLVDTSVLPDVFAKVVKAKKLLLTGECSTASEAAKRLGISRSVFYKYKDHVFPIEEMGKDRIITIFFLLLDHPGVLSAILYALATAGANILTINQNIPVNSVANVTITFRSKDMNVGLGEMLNELRALNGVRSAEVIAGD